MRTPTLSLGLMGIPLLLVFIGAAHYFAGNSSWVTLFDNLHWTLGYFLGALFAWQGVNANEPHLHTTKLIMAWGLSFLFIGQVCWDLQVFMGWNPYPGPSDLFYILLGPCTILAFWYALSASLTARQMRAIPFDIGTISIALVTFVLALYFPKRESLTPLQFIVTLAYPVFLLTAAAVAFLFFLRNPPRLHWSWVLLLIGLSVQGFAWLKWNLLTLDNALAGGTWLNFSFSLSALVIGISLMHLRTEASLNDRYKAVCSKILLAIPLVVGLLISIALWYAASSPNVLPAMRTIIVLTAPAMMFLIVIRQTILLSDSELLLAAEQQIHKLAYYDALTQLPNRRLLQEKLDQCLSDAQRTHHFGALLFIDVDNFKMLNDSRGHNAGDLLLVAIAQRLTQKLSAADIIARLGGDEFVVVISHLDHDLDTATAQAENIAERLVNAISEPYQIEYLEHHASISIGITLFSNDSNSSNNLLKQADSAMYKAKSAGRNGWYFYEQAMSTELEHRLLIENWMRSSLPSHYELYYQPQLDNQGNIYGAEALLRLKHPDQGFIPPAEFIPLAEETGLIFAIGQWVLNQACKQLKLWEQDPKLCHLQLAVNLSPRQLKEKNFVSSILDTIHSHAIKPHLLKLEITESAVMDSIDDTIKKMNALREHGVIFSIDDFGTGHSSLAYLTRLPLNQLKIDRSFVANMLSKANDAVIVQTIIAMARSLNLELIAEGVETREHYEFLLHNGCNNFQGYYFSRPVALNEFEQLCCLPTALSP